MEQDFNKDQPIDVITGATTDQTAASTLSTLPMIIWLRGDEEHCQDFVIDADEAMQQLGIRRSRLTQISGKELRVGRIRSGRYIRPIYRQEDLDEYKKWTRPTASHQKSSGLLEKAANSLKEKATSLEESFHEISENFGHDVIVAVQTSSTESQQRSEKNNEALNTNFTALTERVENNEKTLEKLSSQLEQALSILSTLPRLTQEVASLADTCQEIANGQNEHSKTTHNANNTLLEHIDTITETIEGAEQRNSAKISHALTKIDSHFAPHVPRRKATSKIRRKAATTQKTPKVFNKARSRSLKYRSFLIR